MTALQFDICVPVDDGAVQRGFERLDAQMDAWLIAMKRLDSHLQTTASVVSGPNAHAANESSRKTPVTDAIVPEIASVGSTGENIVAQAAQVTQTLPVATQQPKPVVQEAKAATVVAPAASSPSIADVPVKQAELDGDALLATLDVETAKDIRVMRRMSFGQRTVRELLIEYQTKKIGQPAGDEAGKSKSWWRR